MQAIETKYISPKYISPTNTKGSRIRATCEAKSIIVNWDYDLCIEQNHRQAAKKLTHVLGWNVELSSGCLKNGNYVHVLYGKDRK